MTKTDKRGNVREPKKRAMSVMLTTDERLKKILLAEVLYPGGFYRCPTTNRVLSRLEGDDKVLCPCGVQNGVHIARFLKPATAAEWVDENGY